MNYAIIKDGIVINVIVADYHTATRLASKIGGIAVNSDRYPVQIGDEYTTVYGDEQVEVEGELVYPNLGQFFFRGDTQLPYIPTTVEKLTALENNVIDALIVDNLLLTEAVDTLILDSLEV